MKESPLTGKEISAYAAFLRQEERSPGTVDKYLRDTRAFAQWLDKKALTRETTIAWKEHLLTQGYAPVTINSMLAAVNGLLRSTW